MPGRKAEFHGESFTSLPGIKKGQLVQSSQEPHLVLHLNTGRKKEEIGF